MATVQPMPDGDRGNLLCILCVIASCSSGTPDIARDAGWWYMKKSGPMPVCEVHAQELVKTGRATGPAD